MWTHLCVPRNTHTPTKVHTTLTPAASSSCHAPHPRLLHPAEGAVASPEGAVNTAARNTLMWHCGKCFHFHSARSGVAGVCAAVPLCWDQISGAAVHVAAPPSRGDRVNTHNGLARLGSPPGGEVSDLGLPWPHWPHRPQYTSFSCPLMSLLGTDGPGPLLWHPCSLPSHLK